VQGTTAHALDVPISRLGTLVRHYSTVDQSGVARTRGWSHVAKFGFVVAAVVASAVVLWSRQTDNALLRTDSFPAAMREVSFFAFPGLALYLVFARQVATVVIEGFAIAGLLVAQWWTSATDRHSTAGIGPFFVGWLVVPAVVLLSWVVPQLVREWNTGLVSTPAKVALLIPATLGLFLVGPVGLIVAALLWFAALRGRVGRTDARDLQ
jgi:hypothetical protein